MVMRRDPMTGRPDYKPYSQRGDEALVIPDEHLALAVHFRERRSVKHQAMMTREEINLFLEGEFPQIFVHGPIYTVEHVAPLKARMRMAYHESQLRPGGTISGPAMMALADLALYVAVLASIGPVGLAVTTNLSINFLRKPEPKSLIADCRLMKLGKRLAVGEVSLFSEDSDPIEDVVAHVTGTYSIPDQR
jgi:uncharacterized protein (TIGR00369 family)